MSSLPKNNYVNWQPQQVFWLLAVILFLASIIQGAFWLPQGASNQELLANLAKARDYWQGLLSVGGWPWWTPHYNLGHSLATGLGTAFTYIPMLLFSEVFGEIVGPKLAGLAYTVGAGLAMYGFVQALTKRPWCGFTAGIFYALAPQIPLRLAYNEHMVVAFSFVWVPLILWAMLRMSEWDGWVAPAALAASMGAMMLTYVRPAVTLLPLLVAFAVYLGHIRPGSYRRLGIGILRALALFVPLAVFPLLPFIREASFATFFSMDPFDGWQQSFSLKTLLSWIDRDAWVYQGLPPYFPTDKGGYYLTAVGLLTLGVFYLRRTGRAGCFYSDWGRHVRFFTLALLLLVWLSFGPRSPLQGQLEFLRQAQSASSWTIPLSWLLFFAPGLLLLHGWPTSLRYRWVGIVLACAVFYLVPGFRLMELLPVYRDLRAPWSFWEVGGTAALAVAVGVALPHMLETLARDQRTRRFAMAGLALLAVVDLLPYQARFAQGALPEGTFRDFQQTADYLAKRPEPGSVLFASGRYFYLLTPLLTGRPLQSEAFHSHYMLQWMRRFLTSPLPGPDYAKLQWSLAGSRFGVIDKQDPDTPLPFQQSLRSLFPVVRENAHFAVLENPLCLAPAFLARDYVSFFGYQDGIPLDQVYLLLSKNIGAVEQKRNKISHPIPVAVATPDAPTQLPPRFNTANGSPFVLQGIGWQALDYHTRVVTALPPEGGLLALTEAYHPDWKAFSRGRELPVDRAYGAFIGTVVPSGISHVTFVFSPPFWYGWVLSLSVAAWLAITGWLIRYGLFEKRSG